MTVIRPNSISGITSITAQANEINVFRSNGLIAGLNLNGVNFNTTAGISTLAALKITGNLDVEGVLTYQDVTNVDSLGIGTFRTGINVSGGQLDVGSNIKLGNAGVITATSLDISGDIDVDGHTNLDNVSIVGVTTFNGLSTNDVIRVRAADTNGISVINILAEGTTGHSRIKFSDTAGTDGQISYTHTDRALTFAAGGTTEKVRMLSGGGITFNGDTADANALDDYEEGTFTVTLANSLTVGGQTTLSYTKIGNKVHISGQFKVTSGGSDLIVSNLPFTTKNTGSTDETFSTGICGLYNVTFPTDGSASGEIVTKTQKNDTNLYFVYNRTGNDPNQHTATTNGYYTVSHWYTAA